MKWRYPTAQKWRDLIAGKNLIFNRNLDKSISDKIKMVKQIFSISSKIESRHHQEEILDFIEAIVALPRESKGVVVEAGCFKGSSTAKFSLATNMVGKELVVFDSFQGLPDNNDTPNAKNISGGNWNYRKGNYCGTLDEVITNVSKYGKIASCRFIEGWFEDTMPKFNETISAIFLDVDLASSTRTCLKHLYPLLEPGGVLFSHDGLYRPVMDLLNDDFFWLNEIGCRKPKIVGFGKKKLIKIVKEN